MSPSPEEENQSSFPDEGQRKRVQKVHLGVPVKVQEARVDEEWKGSWHS